jgi:hypothetical protein
MVNHCHNNQYLPKHSIDYIFVMIVVDMYIQYIKRQKQQLIVLKSFFSLLIFILNKSDLDFNSDILMRFLMNFSSLFIADWSYTNEFLFYLI